MPMIRRTIDISDLEVEVRNCATEGCREGVVIQSGSGETPEGRIHMALP